MNKEQLLQLRKSIDAQLCWALRHSGDEELLDLLRSESDRLCAITERAAIIGRNVRLDGRAA